jgi:ribosome recycling factor
LRTKGADYYFGIPPDIFDENYEKLNPIIEGCILRSNTGLSPEVDLDKLLVEYQNLTQKSS